MSGGPSASVRTENSHLTHLFICREYPPAAYPPGGIGTYLRHIAGALARAGVTVHVIAHRWEGAPMRREALLGGRLILHRVALDEPMPARSGRVADARVPLGLLASRFPAQAFSWQAALLTESLIASEGVDVIEAQEWEAPLYYLLVRRALGLGPAKRPPCVVHIHSPSERIFAANGWDTSVADYAPAAGLEEYCITAADAVLCPSQFVADEVMARYAVDRAVVSVVPYPRGDVPVVARSSHTWDAGTICHVGRLEPRKGVLEWVDAIAMVAADHPDAQFDFVGGDTPLHVTGGPTVGRAMLARVPRRVRRQLRFHGTRDRDGVLEVLSAARAAVVPSRWENFPFSCIEAMSTGLPVVVSPNGGMREMLEDGVSGWVAPDATPAGLAQALRRALAAAGAERQHMGEAAAARIRGVCDNDVIVARHLELKARLARGGSRGAPAVVVAPGPGGPGGRGERRPTSGAEVGVREGVGVVVAGEQGSAALVRCLAALREQTMPAVNVRVVCRDGFPEPAAIGDMTSWQTVRCDGRELEEAVMAAAYDLVAAHGALLGIVFVNADVQLERDCLATCATLLAGDDRLAIASGWIDVAGTSGGIEVPPCPTSPHVWHDGDVAPIVAVRCAAVAAVAAVHNAPSRVRALTAVVDAGWTTVTYPGVLGTIVPGPGHRRRSGRVRFSSMAGAVQRLHTPLLQWLRACSPDEQRAFVSEGLRSPGRSVRWLANRAVQGWRPCVRTLGIPSALHDDPKKDQRNVARRTE